MPNHQREMVEWVARAMADLNADGCEVTIGGGSIAACIGPCVCRELARAAMTAMREPTEAMCRAAISDHSQTVRALWGVMIDAALEES